MDDGLPGGRYKLLLVRFHVVFRDLIFQQSDILFKPCNSLQQSMPFSNGLIAISQRNTMRD